MPDLKKPASFVEIKSGFFMRKILELELFCSE